MSAGSLTVHGRTLSPSACASARSFGVRLRQNIDQVPQPAAATSAGQRARNRAARIPRATARSRRRAPAPPYSCRPISIVRHEVSNSGARRFISTSVRQSNDCKVTRSATSRSRTTARTSVANVAGSGVSPAGRRDLGLDVESHRLAARLGQVEQFGERGEALAVARPLIGERARVLRRRIDAADVVAPQLGEGQRMNLRPGSGEPVPRAVAHEVGHEIRVVPDDET